MGSVRHPDEQRVVAALAGAVTRLAAGLGGAGQRRHVRPRGDRAARAVGQNIVGRVCSTCRFTLGAVGSSIGSLTAQRRHRYTCADPGQEPRYPVHPKPFCSSVEPALGGRTHRGTAAAGPPGPARPAAIDRGAAAINRGAAAINRGAGHGATSFPASLNGVILRSLISIPSMRIFDRASALRASAVAM